MRFKIVSLTLFFVIGFTFSNCDDCDCRGALPYFDVIGLSASHQRVLGNNEFEQIDGLVQFPFQSYAGISAVLDVEEIAMQECSSWSISTMPSALSCSCIGNGILGAKNETFTNFDVITVYDYDDTYPANSSIRSALSLRIVEYGTEDYNGMLEDYLDERADELIEHRMYLLKPLTAPTLNNKKMQLLIRMELSSGEVYEVLTEEMEFL